MASVKHALSLLSTGLLLLIASSATGAVEVPARISGTDLVTGKVVSIELKGSQDAKPNTAKGAVILFLSSQCPCSRSHEPKLSELAREFGPKGYSFIAIHSNADESEADGQAHFSEAALSFPVIRDRNGSLAKAFGALKTPHAFILKDGVAIYQGGVDSSAIAENAKEFFLRDALLAIEKGEKPPKSITRCLGCVIKRP